MKNRLPAIDRRVGFPFDETYHGAFRQFDIDNLPYPAENGFREAAELEYNDGTTMEIVINAEKDPCT